MDMTESAATLKKYRSDHLIAVRIEGDSPAYTYRCGVDGIRLLPMRNGRWRHHPDDIVKLLEAEYGGPWGAPKAAVR
jgi:hypothetical protein